MCVNPIKIRNNRIDFDPSIDKYDLLVNCGKCFECEKQKSSDYETRCIAESIYGFTNVYFFTLTFNNQHLPVVEYNGVSYPCFDVRLVQLFLKRLREKMPCEFKYFLTSEYGGLRGRPHHHLLLFCESPVEYLKNKVLSSWKYGFVYPRKRSLDDGSIKSIDAISYVCKYVCKGTDIPFLSKDLLEYYGNLFHPFHLQSIGLGKCIKDIITDNNLVSGKFEMVTDKDVRSYYIPNYIFRKLLYNTELNSNGNVRYVLNSKGIDIKCQRALIYVNHLFNDMVFVRNHALEFIEKYPVLPLDSVIEFNKLPDSTLFDLAKYKIVYYGTQFLPMTGNVVHDIRNYFNSVDNRKPIVFTLNKTSYFLDFVFFNRWLDVFNRLNSVRKYMDDKLKYQQNIIFKKSYYGKKYKKENVQFRNYFSYIFGVNNTF